MDKLVKPKSNGKPRTRETKKLYYGTNNTAHQTKNEYKPIEVYKRVLNPKTETYEYITEIINHKLNWENQVEHLKANLLDMKEEE